MSRRANPRLIGLFVLGALALVVAALAVFGGGRLLARSETFVLFFEDDVAGLQVGGPVTFRGVRIGSVTDIRIRVGKDDQEITIPVFIKLDQRQATMAGDTGWEGLVERGLRAQLKLQSFVTGQVVVEFDMDPRSPPRLVGAIRDYPEIPTKRSSISQLRATVSDLITELRRIPIERIVDEFGTISQNTTVLLTRLDALIVDVNTHVNASFAEVPALISDTRKMIADMDGVAREIQALTRTVGTDVPQITQGTLDAVNRLNKTLAQAETSMSSIQNTLGDRSPLQFQMSQALTEITAAASAMRVLAEYLQENPGVLVSGKGAPP